MSFAASLQTVADQKGYEAAFLEAVKRLSLMDAQQNDLWASRFFEVRLLDGGVKKLWPVTEREISNVLDTLDISGIDAPEYFYCDEQGKLHSVTVGKQQRFNSDEDAPFYYADAPLLANGVQVGTVLYTDH